jgi:hypothetical protein
VVICESKLVLAMKKWKSVLRKKSPEGKRSGENNDEEEFDFAILIFESSSFFSISQ